MQADVASVGLDELARACGESPVPVVAIGGIDSARARPIALTGAAADGPAGLGLAGPQRVGVPIVDLMTGMYATIV